MARRLCPAAGLGHAPSMPGLCSPRTPQPHPGSAHGKTSPSQKPRGADVTAEPVFTGDLPPSSSSFPIPALPDPVPCSSPCPQHGSPSYLLPEPLAIRPQRYLLQARSCPLSAPGRGDVPAPVTCLSPACPQHPQPSTRRAGGSLHSGKTCRVLTCSQILSASRGPWIVFTPSRA